MADSVFHIFNQDSNANEVLGFGTPDRLNPTLRSQRLDPSAPSPSPVHPSDPCSISTKRIFSPEQGDPSSVTPSAQQRLFDKVAQVTVPKTAFRNGTYEVWSD
jgi:hypothetical protein